LADGIDTGVLHLEIQGERADHAHGVHLFGPTSPELRSASTRSPSLAGRARGAAVPPADSPAPPSSPVGIEVDRGSELLSGLLTGHIAPISASTADRSPGDGDADSTSTSPPAVSGLDLSRRTDLASAGPSAARTQRGLRNGVAEADRGCRSEKCARRRQVGAGTRGEAAGYIPSSQKGLPVTGSSRQPRLAVGVSSCGAPRRNATAVGASR
jgi:hypothetical protein